MVGQHQRRLFCYKMCKSSYTKLDTVWALHLKNSNWLAFHLFKRGDFFKRETLKKEIVSHITYNFKIIAYRVYTDIKKQLQHIKQITKARQKLRKIQLCQNVLSKKRL